MKILLNCSHSWLIFILLLSFCLSSLAYADDLVTLDIGTGTYVHQEFDRNIFLRANYKQHDGFVAGNITYATGFMEDEAENLDGVRSKRLHMLGAGVGLDVVRYSRLGYYGGFRGGLGLYLPLVDATTTVEDETANSFIKPNIGYDFALVTGMVVDSIQLGLGYGRTYLISSSKTIYENDIGTFLEEKTEDLHFGQLFVSVSMGF